MEAVYNKERTLKFVPDNFSKYFRVYMTPEHPFYHIVSRGTLGLEKGGYLTGGLVDDIEALDWDCWIYSGVVVENGSTVRLKSIIKKQLRTSDLFNIINSKIFNSRVTCECGNIINSNLAANVVNINSKQSINIQDSNFFGNFIDIDGNSVEVKNGRLSGNISLVGYIRIINSDLKGNTVLQRSGRFKLSDSVVLGNIIFEGDVELKEKFIDQDGVLSVE